MALIVGIDAYIAFSTNGGTSWTGLAGRNEFSISIQVDNAEGRVFAASLADAWVQKRRTWMSWSGSISGLYDDADDTIFDTMVAGQLVKIRFYPSRYDATLTNNLPTAITKYWMGDALLTSVEHGVGTDDFATLNVDFEGSGALLKYPQT
jgi:hypothetical protein